MKALVVAALLPAVAGGAWLLVNELPAPSAPDEPAGDVHPFVAVDSSGHENDGIIQGPVVMGLPGHQGTSYSFSRHGSWIQVPSAPGIDPKNRDFLFSVWVQFDEFDEFPGPGETYDVVRKGVAYTAPGEFKLEVLSGARVRCTAKDASGAVAVVVGTSVIPEDATWHRIGCARTGPYWSVLIDDAIHTRVVDLGPVSNSVPLSIGAKYGMEDRPSGRVDDVRFSMGKRSDLASPDETGVPAAIHALERQRPTAWWRLDEGAPSPAGP